MTRTPLLLACADCCNCSGFFMHSISFSMSYLPNMNIIDIAFVDNRHFVVVNSHAYRFKINDDYCTTLLHAPCCVHVFVFLGVVPPSLSYVASPSFKYKVLKASARPSQVVACKIFVPPPPVSSFTQHGATSHKTKDDDSTSLLVDGDGATGIAEFQECPIVFKSSFSTVRIHVLWLVFFQPGIGGAAAINS